jgi:hypothetical protein
VAAGFGFGSGHQQRKGGHARLARGARAMRESRPVLGQKVKSQAGGLLGASRPHDPSFGSRAHVKLLQGMGAGLFWSISVLLDFTPRARLFFSDLCVPCAPGYYFWVCLVDERETEERESEQELRRRPPPPHSSSQSRGTPNPTFSSRVASDD